MSLPDCTICRAPMRARLIEADWAGGMSAAGISRTMAESGWTVSSATILNHLKKHVKDAAHRQNVPIGMTKRDATAFVRDRILDAVEQRERNERMEAEIEEREPDLSFILDKDLQPALGTALKAEAIVVKKEDNSTKRKLDLFRLMLGGDDGKGMLAPTGLIGDGNTVEGTAVEMPIDEDEDDDSEA